MQTARFSFVQAPDLMERLISAQNHLRAPIDIVTFAGFCDSREELETHIRHYEELNAAQAVAS